MNLTPIKPAPVTLMRAVAVALSIVAFGAFPQTLLAQAPQPGAGESQTVIKIAVIDIQAVRVNAEATKDVYAQMTAYRDSIQTGIQDEETELRKGNEELARKRTLLDPAAFEAERKTFEDKVTSLQRHVQESKQAMDRVQGEAMKLIDSELFKVVSQIVQDENLTLVFHKSATVAIATQMDISPVVLKRLNEKLPKVKVADPKIARK